MQADICTFNNLTQALTASDVPAKDMIFMKVLAKSYRHSKASELAEPAKRRPRAKQAPAVMYSWAWLSKTNKAKPSVSVVGQRGGH